jgi:HAD superfamily hydrolase (TIGR01509 family)
MHLVETRVDGVVSAELGLKGKPEADIFTTAADNLGCSYHRCIVVEDAVSGVQAGRAGRFGLVLGPGSRRKRPRIV